MMKEKHLTSKADTVKRCMKRQKKMFKPNTINIFKKEKDCTSHQNILVKIQFLRVKEECDTVIYHSIR